tara:strand:- start:322 stop:954 length:633 start_codon:yes stop_codon:yes gene_type:complete
LAKALAKSLGYLFIDSGAMYRAFSLYCIEQNIEPFQVKQNFDKLKNIQIQFQFDDDKDFYFTQLNNTNVEEEIRQPYVSAKVSDYSTLKIVRDFMVDQQQKIGIDKGVVMDGRDIGTVVFPNAELKIFMTAMPEVRANRRYNELIAKGINVSYDQILKNLVERDKIDSTRKESPLKKADDAITLDNTDMTREQQAKLALTWAEGVIASFG